MQRPKFAVHSLILLTLFLCSSCSSLDKMLGEQRPDATIVGASLSNLDSQSATINFDVEVDNPYGIDIPVLGLDFGLASGGQSFLNGAMNDPGFIPARGKRVLPVAAKVPFAEALRLLSGLRPGAVVPYQADIGLKLDVPALGEYAIPLRHEGEFPIPAIPQVSVSDFKWESFGLTGAVANVAFNFGNTNQFPISLNDLGYDFELAGKRVFRGSVDDKFNLKPGEDGSFNLRLELSALELGVATYRLLSGGKADYGFVGNAILGSAFGDIALPIDNRGNTTMRR